VEWTCAQCRAVVVIGDADWLPPLGWLVDDDGACLCRGCQQAAADAATLARGRDGSDAQGTGALDRLARAIGGPRPRTDPTRRLFDAKRGKATAIRLGFTAIPCDQCAGRAAGCRRCDETGELWRRGDLTLSCSVVSRLGTPAKGE
jgi:hypothetical protein